MRPDSTSKKYRALKASLISKGTNLKRWAEDNQYPLTTVYLAASGKRAGVKSITILEKLHRYAGLN
jgi:hypothetical protein